MGNANRRIIDFALDASLETDHAYVATNSSPRKAEPMEAYVGATSAAVVLRDKRPIGGACILDHAQTFFTEDPEGDTVILPADYVHQGISLAALQRYHRSVGGDITLLTAPPRGYGDYVTVQHGLARATTKVPGPNDLTITGIYMISNQYLMNWMTHELRSGWDGQPRSMSRDVIWPAILRDTVAVCNIPEGAYWDDAGTLDRYHVNSMRLSGGRNVVSERAQIDPQVSLNRSVVVGEPAINGPGCYNNVIISGSATIIRVTQL
jgi:ADP-glucose pyrophosphorylase